MRIAIFTNNYLPNPYGVTGSVESFRESLERLGHTVYIFAPQYKEYEDTNKHVFRYPSVDVAYKFRFPLPIPYSWKISRALENLDIDVVHAQHSNLLGSAARRWAKKKHVPLVFTWHTLYDRYAHFGPSFFGKWYAQRLIKKAVRYANSADAVIVPSNSACGNLRAWGVEKGNMYTVSTGVTPKLFVSPDKTKVRKIWNIPEKARVILTVSRLTNEKNIRFLFDAILPIVRKQKDVYFLCVGGGDLLEKLRDLANKEGLGKKLLFIGQVPREDLKHYFAVADMFAYASTSETQGLVISEAMYMGLPVVAVRASGVRDSVMDTITGVLVRENRKEFNRAVQDLLEDTAKRKRMGLQARKIAHTQMTSTVSAKELLRVYKNVM